MTQNPSRTFGQSLRERRIAKGLSVRDFARQTGVSSTYVRHLEGWGGAPPSDELLLAFARVLGTSEDEMLASAGRIPADIKAEILARPGVMFAFLRTLAGASDETLELVTTCNLQYVNEIQAFTRRKVLPFRVPNKSVAVRTLAGSSVR